MNIEEELEQLVRLKNMGACDKCGGELISNHAGKYKCRQCGNIMLDEVGKVREYLEKHGAATYLEVEEQTGVSREVLNKFYNPRRQR